MQRAWRKGHSARQDAKRKELGAKGKVPADELLDIADELENKRLYRFAEQLRSATMSMTNNIAEGSGSTSDKDFNNFLNIARRSTFENANILIILNRRNIISENKLNLLLDKLDKECRMITNFKKQLA